jgi:hypothetical protein
MKKTMIVVAALLMTATIFAQEAEPKEETDSQKRMTEFADAKRHEVGLDVFSAIVIPAFNPRYEYVLDKNSGVGIDVNIDLSDDDEFDEIEIFSITPFYRQYFFSKEDYGAKGFYGEGFLKYYRFKEYGFEFQQNGNSRNLEEDFSELAIGVGIGWKWVSDSGFLIDVGFGVGRNLGIADYDEDIYGDRPIAGRGSVNFGWRF